MRGGDRTKPFCVPLTTITPTLSSTWSSPEHPSRFAADGPCANLDTLRQFRGKLQGLLDAGGLGLVTDQTGIAVHQKQGRRAAAADQLNRLAEGYVQVRLAFDRQHDTFSEIQRKTTLARGERPNHLGKIRTRTDDGHEIAGLEAGVAVRDDKFVATQDGADYPWAGAECLEQSTADRRVLGEAKLHRLRTALGEGHRRDASILETQFELARGKALGEHHAGSPGAELGGARRIVDPRDDAMHARFRGEPNRFQVGFVVVGRGDYRGGSFESRTLEHDAARSVAFDHRNRAHLLGSGEALGVLVDDGDDPAVAYPL